MIKKVGLLVLGLVLILLAGAALVLAMPSGSGAVNGDFAKQLVENGEKIVQLHESVEKVKHDQQRLENEIQFVKRQQSELMEILLDAVVQISRVLNAQMDATPPKEDPPIREVYTIDVTGDENITYEEVPPVRIQEVLRRHASKTILEDGTVCPGDETNDEVPPIKILEAIHHPGDENITYEEVPPVRIREVLRRHASKTILEDEPVCPGDEEPTKPSEDEKPVCSGDEIITYEEVPPLRIERDA